MRTISTVLAICLAIGLCAQSLADQTDPRLDDLFAALATASEAAEAAPIEQSIWNIWLETADDAVDELLRDGIDAMNSGDMQSALENFDAIVSTAPDFAEGWNKRATAHYLMNNLEESLQDIEKTLELEPRHFGALSGRGLVYVKLGYLRRALASFEAALDVNPQMAGPRMNSAAIRRILDQRDI